MNRNKLIGSLLGGGVTIGLLSYGGVKVGEKVHYDNQVKYFGGLRSEFIQQLTITEFKTHTMPKWEDIEIWKTYYENDKDSSHKLHLHSGGKDSSKLINSPTELRDTCYEYLVKELEAKEKNCNGQGGWCPTCLFTKGWHGTNNGNY